MASGPGEIISTFEPVKAAELPTMDQLPDAVTVGPPVEQQLETVYFDTTDLVLAATGITVRRRTGGDHAGWQLTFPAGGADRDELLLPLARATKTVPKPLRAAVRVYTRDRALAPVATVRTHRNVRRLLDAEGHVLAQVCEDVVTAQTPSPSDTGLTSAWREWGIELVDGNRCLLRAAGDLLHEAGADPVRGRATLVRALGDRMPQTVEPVEPARLSSTSPAAAVVQARLRAQVSELQLRDTQVRRDLPDGVHQMRVALRRLRSALATFRPLLDRAVIEPLRGELGWVAGVLGEARDAEVMRDRLAAVITAQPAELVLGPVARRVDAEFDEIYRAAQARVLEALESPRYFAAVDDLDRVAAGPPWTARAYEHAGDVLAQRVRHDWKRLRDQVAAAEAASGSAQYEERLHEVRKAAKRVRYAAEVMTPIGGGSAKRFVKAMKRLQSVLGDHQDSVVVQPRLRELGIRAHLDGDNAFSYGYLHALEQSRAADAEVRYASAWRQASRKKLRSWLA